MTTITGLIALFFAAFGVRQILREIRLGETMLVTNAAGDGLLGYANKSENPTRFWFTVAIHGFVSAGAALLGVSLITGVMS